jgi:hypothetical protein
MPLGRSINCRKARRIKNAQGFQNGTFGNEPGIKYIFSSHTMAIRNMLDSTIVKGKSSTLP